MSAWFVLSCEICPCIFTIQTTHVTPPGKGRRQNLISGAEEVCAFKERDLKIDGLSDFKTQLFHIQMILNLHIVSSCSILQYQKNRNAGSLQTLYLVPQLMLSFPNSIFLTTANTECSIYDPVRDLSHNPPEPQGILHPLFSVWI